jgi:ribosomal protein RSM22 (predicted rRNA methylase)
MPSNDWCHFSQRLERTQLHKIAKEATLGYEDEKFSYVCATNQPVKLPQGRILRHPNKHSGHIEFTLCSQGKLEKKVISRKAGELYKMARKLEWGDSISFIKEKD